MKKRLLGLAVAAGLLAGAMPALAMDDDHAMRFGAVEVEQLEWRFGDGRDALFWDAQAWYGGDTDRIVLRAEGEKPSGEAVEEAEFHLLWSRMVSEFWNVEAGLRHDVRPRPQTTYLTVGLAGLAPFFIETESHLYLSEEGDLTAEGEGEFELLLTQRLHLVADASLQLSAQKVEELEIGAGFTDLELGLRLKFEIARELAPYVGVVWNHKLGDTADLAREEGEETESLSLVTGVSFWF